MANVIALIDGFNVYHALAQRSRHGGYPYRTYKWINYWWLAECFVPKTDTVQKVLWFTADSPIDGRKGVLKRSRHLRLRRANEDHGVEIVDGYFRPVTRSCRFLVPKGSVQYQTYEEKRTDVAIAVSLVALAYQKAYDKALLISADSDMIPAVQEAKRVHPTGTIINVVPIERRARALRNYVDQQMRMKTKHLANSRMPNRYTHSSGHVIRCPKAWS